MLKSFPTNTFCAALLLLLAPLRAQAADQLFDDPVIAKGKGIEIRLSELDDAFIAFKGTKAAAGEKSNPADDPKVRGQILNKMISTKLLLSRANDADKKAGAELAEKMVQETLSKAPSEAAFKRQLLAFGSNFDKYKSELTEEATVKAVIDREIGKEEKIGEAEILKFYNDNPDFFQEPEGVRVRHILFALRSIPDGQPIDPKAAQAKKELAHKTLTRIQAGADFEKLARELSDDPEAKKTGGLLSVRKGARTVPSQFEAAAFSLAPGKVSDLVSSVFGYHIIKMEEKLPQRKEDLEKVHDRIKGAIMKTKIEKKLPAYLDNLKKESGLELFDPTRRP
jgi:peptidyl-prolyl cis-trans isomerase C